MTEDSSGNPVYPYTIGPKMYGSPLFEGNVVPDIVDVFPDGAAGNIVLTDTDKQKRKIGPVISKRVYQYIC